MGNRPLVGKAALRHCFLIAPRFDETFGPDPDTVGFPQPVNDLHSA